MRLDVAPMVFTEKRKPLGRVRLAFERRGGRTVLARKFASSPFGAVWAHYPDENGMPEVQITNPSGGILGGDDLEVQVELASESHATVLTQAANKAYRGVESVQRAELRVGENALLEYLPHHLIPHPKSSYRATTKFHLASTATLVTWDAYAAGRIARNERFAFDKLHAKTTILRDGTPAAIDAFHLTGGYEHFSGYSYLASAYIVAPTDLSQLAENLHDALAYKPRALASASAPAGEICAVRILTDNTMDLYKMMNRCREISRSFLDLTPPSRSIS